MRFPHNTKIFRGQLDMAPFAGVLFLLLIFLLLQSSMVFTPGLPIRLPETANLPGSANPSVAVAVDSGNVIYFENQAVSPVRLAEKLKSAVEESKEPLTLIIQADREVKYEMLVQLGLLARDVGIKEALLATSPSVFPEVSEGKP